MRPVALRCILIGLWLLIAVTPLLTQSRRSVRADADGMVLSVTAVRTDSKPDPIKLESLFLYENGIEQRLKSFSYDPSPAKIVILVDNSQTLPIDVEQMKKAVMEFSYEIFEGDQLFVIAFDEKPEIIQEWTDDPKKLEASLATFRKKGNPFLFDALEAASREVIIPLMPGTRKTAIVMIGDGVDRGSKTSFDKALHELQANDITVYALQLPDRTRGAFRRGQPKAPQVIAKLTEGTGGLVFEFENVQAAAKTICDELRKNRYLLSYAPQNTASYDARRLLLTADEGITVRTKMFQPPNVK